MTAIRTHQIRAEALREGHVISEPSGAASHVLDVIPYKDGETVEVILASGSSWYRHDECLEVIG